MIFGSLFHCIFWDLLFFVMISGFFLCPFSFTKIWIFLFPCLTVFFGLVPYFMMRLGYLIHCFIVFLGFSIWVSSILRHLRVLSNTPMCLFVQIRRSSPCSSPAVVILWIWSWWLSPSRLQLVCKSSLRQQWPTLALLHIWSLRFFIVLFLTPNSCIVHIFSRINP